MTWFAINLLRLCLIALYVQNLRASFCGHTAVASSVWMEHGQLVSHRHIVRKPRA